MSHTIFGGKSPAITARRAVAARTGETFEAQVDRMVASVAAREWALEELRRLDRALRAEAEVTLALRELGL
jgi:hypothetical protein